MRLVVRSEMSINVGVNSKGESWSSVKEKMYEHIRMGNSIPLPREDVEETHSPLGCDGASEFLLVFIFLAFSFSLLHFSFIYTGKYLDFIPQKTAIQPYTWNCLLIRLLICAPMRHFFMLKAKGVMTQLSIKRKTKASPSSSAGLGAICQPMLRILKVASN